VAALAAAAAITILIFMLAGGETPDRTRDRPSPARTQTQAPGPAVPAVVGLPLGDALRELAAAGIDQVEVEATPGERGVVIDVDPAEGSTLTEDEPVTLFVGNGEEEGGNGDDHGKGKGKGNGKGND
jgi:hypothetical protein